MQSCKLCRLFYLVFFALLQLVLSFILEGAMFTLCHCALEICDLFYSFIYVLQGILVGRFLCVSEEILDHVDTVKTQGTFGDGLRAHCIISST